MKFNSLALGFISFLLVFSAQLHSAPLPYMERLTAELQNYLDVELRNITAKGFRITYEIGSIDPRLQLNTCKADVKFKPSRSFFESKHNTLLVSCVGAKPWKIYVPISVEIYGPQVVTSRPLARGTRLNASDLRVDEVIINQSRYPAFTKLDDIIGMKLKRNVKADRIVTPSILVAPSIINKGDEVLIVAKNRSIRIEMKGEALRNGVHGQQIPVKNLKSKRIIKAQVLSQGMVTVPL